MSTRSELLVSAESLLRTKGYAAFSYADLAEAIGIKKASIHHHFATKEILGVAIVESYLFRFSKRLDEVNSEFEHSLARLRAYQDFFLECCENGMLPLCGALAAEVAVLPVSLRVLTMHFFEMHIGWLESNVALGQSQGDINPALDVKEVARTLLGLLEGGSFVSWALKDKPKSSFGLELFIKGISACHSADLGSASLAV
ncbi:TetR/AcrR family transcriptional regulator [Pseudomonas atacamensis]|uniref:TetR/AcrR family transcriptional regulator n=1 Tax=Pseudomonas atacamensis TaxID=2565368 RepID=A0AAQ2HYB8_9PSED|nr:TetR/AcrR family transcriptional regulator [Pseudomonas atacamensis]THF25799.1 TetR/AcrR family transcriptional regulator [Pseudomonas atacamensis]